jgi:transposase InsO family protein
MTYIPTREGWLYLPVALDLFSRRIVGRSTGATIDAAPAGRALEMAWRQRSPNQGLILHGDRGSRHAGGRYTELLVEHGIKHFHSRCNPGTEAPATFLGGKRYLAKLPGSQ